GSETGPARPPPRRARRRRPAGPLDAGLSGHDHRTGAGGHRRSLDLASPLAGCDLTGRRWWGDHGNVSYSLRVAAWGRPENRQTSHTSSMRSKAVDSRSRPSCLATPGMAAHRRGSLWPLSLWERVVASVLPLLQPAAWV